MGKGPLGLLKLHLIAKVQFCRFTTGPDLSNRGLFFKAALPSPDVAKCDQNGSAWVSKIELLQLSAVLGGLLDPYPW